MLADGDEVLNQLQHVELVHFACHGFSDPHDPLTCHLLLKKDTAESGEVVE
jgi:CHAT domain-containing protein